MMVWWMEIFTQKNVHPPQSFNTQKLLVLGAIKGMDLQEQLNG